MGDAGAQPQQNGRVILLGQTEGSLGEVIALLGVGRLQHGNLGGDGMMAGILLVLGGVHAGIVRHADHKTAVDAGIGHGKQRIRRHIQAHVLHSAAAALSAQGGAEGGLHGHLFVGGPLRVDLGIARRLLRDLRGGGAGIAGHHAATGVIQTPGNRGVADVKLFQSDSSFRTNVLYAFKAKLQQVYSIIRRKATVSGK